MSPRLIKFPTSNTKLTVKIFVIYSVSAAILCAPGCTKQDSLSQKESDRTKPEESAAKQTPVERPPECREWLPLDDGRLD